MSIIPITLLAGVGAALLDAFRPNVRAQQEHAASAVRRVFHEYPGFDVIELADGTVITVAADWDVSDSGAAYMVSAYDDVASFAEGDTPAALAIIPLADVCRHDPRHDDPWVCIAEGGTARSLTPWARSVTTDDDEARVAFNNGLTLLIAPDTIVTQNRPGTPAATFTR